jgi:hypothetical protein
MHTRGELGGMDRAAHTIVSTGLERRYARAEISIGSDRDDRQIGRVAAKLSARVRDVRGRDEDHVWLEHVQQPRGPGFASDGEYIVSATRELARQLWLRDPMYEQDPQRTRDRLQTRNALVKHAPIVERTCEPDVRGT